MSWHQNPLPRFKKTSEWFCSKKRCTWNLQWDHQSSLACNTSTSAEDHFLFHEMEQMSLPWFMTQKNSTDLKKQHCTKSVNLGSNKVPIFKEQTKSPSFKPQLEWMTKMTKDWRIKQAEREELSQWGYTEMQVDDNVSQKHKRVQKEWSEDGEDCSVWEILVLLHLKTQTHRHD